MYPFDFSSSSYYFIPGEFGSVFKGEWQYTNSAGVKIAEEVAVKTLKGG